MWNMQITLGCVLMAVAWVAAFALIFAGWAAGSVYVAHVGLALSAAAAALTVQRDNQRTRSQIRAATKRLEGGGDNTVRHFVRPSDY